MWISFCATLKLTTKIDGTLVKTQILRDSRLLHQGASTDLVFRGLIGSLPGCLYSTHVWAFLQRQAGAPSHSPAGNGVGKEKWLSRPDESPTAVIGAVPSPKRPVRKHGEAIELCHHIADRATTHASLNTKPRHHWYFRSAPLDGQGRRMPQRTYFGLSHCRGDSDPLSADRFPLGGGRCGA